MKYLTLLIEFNNIRNAFLDEFIAVVGAHILLFLKHLSNDYICLKLVILKLLLVIKALLRKRLYPIL